MKIYETRELSKRNAEDIDVCLFAREKRRRRRGRGRGGTLVVESIALSHPRVGGNIAFRRGLADHCGIAVLEEAGVSGEGKARLLAKRKKSQRKRIQVKEGCLLKMTARP